MATTPQVPQIAGQAPDEKIRQRVYVALLFAVVVFAYINSLRNAFTMDDIQLYIVRNPQVTHPSLRALFTANPLSGVFRPVTFSSFALDWKLGGGQPFEFHVVNLLLHAGVTVLLYFLLRRLLEAVRHGEMVAFAAALLFAVHPIHTEAVTSIVGRAELLAAGFVLAAWMLHLKDREIPALACFVLALLSKESAVAFLPLMIIGDYVMGNWKPALRYARAGVVLLLYLAVLWKAQGGHLGLTGISLMDNPLAGIPARPRVLNALRVAWKYVALQAYPARLSCDYSFNEIPLYPDWRRGLPALAASVAVMGGWMWAIWKRQAALMLAGAIYIAGFATTSNILTPIGTIMGERLAYLPSAGFCLVVAVAWNWLRERQRMVAVGLLGVIVAALAARTVVRNRDWKDNLTLFTAALQAAPGSVKVHVALGVAYMHAGNLDLADKEIHQALQINPLYGEGLAADGLLEARRGNFQEAGRLMENAFYLIPPENRVYDEVAVNLANLYMETDHLEGAMSLLNREITQKPGYAHAWATRAALHLKRGETSAARADAETALRLDPVDPQARNVLRSLNSRPQADFLR